MVEQAVKEVIAKDVVVGPDGQVTFPLEILEQLGIEPGERVWLVLDGPVLVVKPRRVVALEALREIQDAFQRSGITEEELQEEAYRVRHGVSEEHRADHT